MLLVLLLPSLSLGSVRGACEQDLATGWVACPQPPGGWTAAAAAAVTAAPADRPADCIAAPVPGTALGALLANGTFPMAHDDPYYGDNLGSAIPDIANATVGFYTFLYLREIGAAHTAPPHCGGGGGRAWLKLRGVNYRHTVYAGGERLAARGGAVPAGMFHRAAYALPITAAVGTAAATVVVGVLVEPPDHVGLPNAGQGGNHDLAKDGAIMQCTGGWDWVKASPDRNTGIWDKVTVEVTAGDVALADPHLATRSIELAPAAAAGGNPATARRATLDVEVLAHNGNADAAASGELQLRVGGLLVAAQRFTVPAAASSFPLRLPGVVLNSVALWWPHTEGAPVLHDAAFAFVDDRDRNSGSSVSAAALTTRFGVRTISTSIDGATAARQFAVNGKRVFLLGGNWIATDQLLRFAGDASRYTAEVGFHADMGLNMLRVWGGALAERPEFYDAADARGVLVWQEFWMTGDNNGRWAGNYSWPLDHAAYLANARDTVLLLRPHASLALWVGGNELYPAGFNPGAAVASGLRAMLRELDPTRFYIPSSMSNHTAYDPDYAMAPKDGPYGLLDLRQYFERNPGLSFWNGSAAPQRADRLAVGFQPEIGSISTPTLASLRRFLPPAALTRAALPPPNVTSEGDAGIHPMWKWHNYLPYAGGDSKADHIFAFGGIDDDGGADGAAIAEYATRAQLVQFSQYRALYEGFAQGMWTFYTAMLMWKSQSPWPSLRGALYDWYLDQTGGFFGVATAVRELLHVQLDFATWTTTVVNRGALAASAPAALNGSSGSNGSSAPPLQVQAQYVDLRTGKARGEQTTCAVGGDGTVAANSVARNISRLPPWPADAKPGEVLLCDVRLLQGGQGGPNAAKVLSRSLYWLSDPALPEQHTRDLGDLRREGPRPVLSASAALSQQGGAVALSLAHNGTASVHAVAFFVRVQLEFANGTRVLPTTYSQNYLTVLRGEAAVVTMTAPGLALHEHELQVSIEGWNVDRHEIKVQQKDDSVFGDAGGVVTGGPSEPEVHPHWSAQLPKPTLVFGTTIRIAEALSRDPLAGAAGDGCLAAEAKLQSGGSAIAVSNVVFDAENRRIRQSNGQLQRVITRNVTNIGKWGLPIPQEWDLTTVAGNLSCATEPLPPIMCPNGTLPPSCPPQFGSWGGLNPFTSIVGMWYPNTSKLEGSSTPSADTFNFMDVQRTLLPNEGCGTSNCTMQHCSSCGQNVGRPCTACPCKNCVMELNVTRNYTYTVAKKAQPDGSHQMIRYQWTQGIPETKSGATPGIGRDCFIFDWSQDWTAYVQDSDFAPPPDVECALSPTPAPPTPWLPSDDCAKDGFPCTAGASVCCTDPNSKGKGTGACYKVQSCSQLPGGGRP